MKTILLSRAHPNEKIFSSSVAAEWELMDAPAQTSSWKVYLLINDENDDLEGYVLRP